MPGAHCVVVGCANGTRQLSEWKSRICAEHGVNYDVAHCICKPPFALFPFPTESKDIDGRRRWTAAVCCTWLTVHCT